MDPLLRVPLQSLSRPKAQARPRVARSLPGSVADGRAARRLRRSLSSGDGGALKECPACGQGHMIFLEALPKLNRRGCFQDTS